MRLNIKTSNWAVRLLCLLLITDISFFIIHLIYSYTSLTTYAGFSIEADRGYAEVFQYLKEYWIALLLGFVALKKRLFPYLSWCVVFFYLLLDDSIGIHERAGFFLGQLGLFNQLYLNATDLGEVTASVMAASFLLFIIATAYRSGDRLFRQVSRNLIKMLVALGLFGVVVDLVHNAVKFPVIQPLLGLLEDGGEMVVMSVIASFVVLLSERLLDDTSELETSGEPFLPLTWNKNR
jgi:hypothetical protein